MRGAGPQRSSLLSRRKTLKTPTGWIIGLTCRFLYCQRHCGQCIAPANRSYRFAHNKNARRQFEGSGRARGRPLSPKRNRPIGANSQWDDSPQAARGYMNLDNRSRLMQPSSESATATPQLLVTLPPGTFSRKASAFWGGAKSDEPRSRPLSS